MGLLDCEKIYVNSEDSIKAPGILIVYPDRGELVWPANIPITLQMILRYESVGLLKCIEAHLTYCIFAPVKKDMG